MHVNKQNYSSVPNKDYSSRVHCYVSYKIKTILFAFLFMQNFTSRVPAVPVNRRAFEAFYFIFKS